MTDALEYRSVIEKLCEKTRAGKVEWKIADQWQVVTQGASRHDKFVADLESYKFLVWRSDDDYFARMEALEAPAGTIFTVRAEEQVIYKSDEARQMFELLSDLYELARRKALNVPQKLADVAELLDRI